MFTIIGSLKTTPFSYHKVAIKMIASMEKGTILVINGYTVTDGHRFEGTGNERKVHKCFDVLGI